jgi:cytochrome P450
VKTLQVDIPAQVAKTRAEVAAGLVSSREHPTVFVELMRSDMPASEKTPERMHNEAVSLLGAATETTSWALGVMTYYLLSQPQTMGRLRAELEAAVEDRNDLPPLTTLEKLPYLSAVIQEGLRLSYGVSSRTARIATNEDLVYRGEFKKKPVELVLPRGFAVGMSSAITHYDEDIFPDSYSFLPERWLDGEGKLSRDLDRAFLSFSKGSRMCLGMK